MPQATSYYINTGLASEHQFLDKKVDDLLRTVSFHTSSPDMTLRVTPQYKEDDYHILIDPLQECSRIESIALQLDKSKEKHHLETTGEGALIHLLYFKVRVSYKHKKDPFQLP